MNPRPNLENQFGVRVATAHRMNPAAGPTMWIAAQLWDTPDYWVITQNTGGRPYDWDFAQTCLGDEEEAGRFASFARDFVAKEELDAAGIQARLEAEFAGHRIAWWDRWRT